MFLCFHVVLWRKFIANYGGSRNLCISSGDNRICTFILELLISCIDLVREVTSSVA